jgi:signal peptidase I
MRKWVRPLLRCGAVAAALLTLAWVTPRSGAVYVAGSSMEPVYAAGDLALYRRAGAGARERDVVLYTRADGARVLHRVTEVLLDRSFVTKGDANAAPDPGSVRPDEVEGVVVAVVPCGRAVRAMVSGVRWCYNHVPIANTGR